MPTDYLLLLPIHGDAAGVEGTLGWAVAPLAIDEALAGLNVAGEGFVVEIVNVEHAGDTPIYASAAREVPADHAQPAAAIELPVAGRTWRIVVRPTARFVGTQALTDPRITGFFGVLVAALLAALTAAALRARAQARELRSARDPASCKIFRIIMQ